MSARRITDEAFYEALDQYADSRRKNSGAIDPGCVYTDHRGRHCVAGQIMEDLDLPVPGWGDPFNAAGLPADHGTAGEDFTLPIRFVRRFRAHQLRILHVAQNYADQGMTWGRALRLAREEEAAR